MPAIAEANSLFEIDAELDSLLEAIEEQAASEASPRKTWLPVSSNFARHAERRLIGSAAFFA